MGCGREEAWICGRGCLKRWEVRFPSKGRHQRSNSIRGESGVICCLSVEVGVKRGAKSEVVNSGGGVW